jgi:hypothetical protein
VSQQRFNLSRQLIRGRQHNPGIILGIQGGKVCAQQCANLMWRLLVALLPGVQCQASGRSHKKDSSWYTRWNSTEQRVCHFFKLMIQRLKTTGDKFF